MYLGYVCSLLLVACVIVFINTLPSRLVLLRTEHQGNCVIHTHTHILVPQAWVLSYTIHHHGAPKKKTERGEMVLLVGSIYYTYNTKARILRWVGCARRVPARPCFLVNAPTDLVKRAADGQTRRSRPPRGGSPNHRRQQSDVINHSFFFNFFFGHLRFLPGKTRGNKINSSRMCCRYCLLLIRLSRPQNTTPVRSLFSPAPPSPSPTQHCMLSSSRH